MVLRVSIKLISECTALQNSYSSHGYEYICIVQDCPARVACLARFHHIVRYFETNGRGTYLPLGNTYFCLCLVSSSKLFHEHIHEIIIVMDLSKKFVRQTHIIDDFDAINIAQGQRKASSKKNKQGSTGPSTHQNASSPKTKNAPKPKASQQADSRFYEKGRTRKVHARLSSSLHNTNTDCLLDTVEEYAGVEKRKEFKNADKSKAEIADWIEAKETLALGPHPRSKLTCKWCQC
jgi:hypothetical protein